MVKLHAQQYFFQNYTPENGLLFTQVSCMFQDSKGYLWGGGYGGLTRFDGKGFENYSPKNGLIDHNVTAITQDQDANMFIGTSKGLSILSGKMVFNYKKDSEGKPLSITALYRLGSHVYLGTPDGLYQYSSGSVKPVEAVSGYKINCIFSNDSVTLLIGTDRGMIVYGGGKLDIIDRSRGLPSDVVKCVAVHKGKIVAGTSRGLSFYDAASGKCSNYFIENGLIDENISALLSQNNEYLWIGSHTGLLRFDGEQFLYYNIGYDNNSNVVRCLLQDRENNVWVGTHSGLFKYRDNSFSTFDKINGPGNAFIFQIFRDKADNLWLCSDNNGVYRYTQGYFKRYGVKEGLGTNVCKTGIQMKNGRIFFGTKNGLLEYRNDAFADVPLPREFKAGIELVYPGKDEWLWIGGIGGIVKMRLNNGSSESKLLGLPFKSNYTVYSFWEDAKGVWIGSAPAGLYLYRNDSLFNMNKKYSFAEENFFTVRTNGDHLFAATLNGLFVLNTVTGETDYISEEDGLNSELVYSIEFAENNQTLWIGTNQGINKLNLKKYIDSKTVDLVTFGKQQGFMGVECNSNGIWEDRDGSLWFGTVSGLVKHEPFTLKKNAVRNITSISRIKLFSEDTALVSGAELRSDYNTISFYYTGICLTNPEKVLYVKRLDGLEKEWSAPSNENYSKYANLAPGKYTFRVKSCNNEGIWDEQETTFTFTVLRPFYATWWFITSLTLGMGTMAYSVVAIRIRNIKRKQKEEYDRKVEMSKIELKALRSQMNPHFIFNSLNSIQHYIFHAKIDEAIKYLNKFARLVRIILSNSNKPTVTVGDDIEALKLYLELEQMRFEEKFDYEIIVDPSVDLDYDVMPPLLLQPYVENAILHGLNPKPGKGKLTIALTSKNNYLICTITDNGIGREKSSEIKRTMPVNKHKSLGMKITEDRLKILNEVNNSQLSVNVTDMKDEGGNALGTQVELFVPYI
jgi:ligand-binding sensor domain-containing protein/two-component sensor histidine kinase